MKILISHAHILQANGIVLEGNIAIEGNTIKMIGDIPASWQPDRTIYAKDNFAVPGFVNAHTHASMTLLRSYADDMKLMDWLQQKIWPIEAKMQKEDIYWGAMLASAEMIKSGTTTFADMYGPDMEQVAEVAETSGLRAVLSRGLIGIAPDADEKLQENVTLFKNWHKKATGRITVMFGPHAPYTCPPDYLGKVAETAKELGAEIHIHMSETKDEVENCIKQYGKRPFAHVASTGLFENGTLAAHCVHLDDKDIAIIKKYGIRVAHSPGSNMKLASGIAPVPRLLAEGVCVALGTDGASSNNNLDMLEEINLAAMLHKVASYDPEVVPAKDALSMGTEYGAKAVGLFDVGVLQEGYKADIVLFNMNSPAWVPRHDLVSSLVYAANTSSVDTVIVDGNILMQKRELLTLDEERILFETQRRVDHLLSV